MPSPAPLPRGLAALLAAAAVAVGGCNGGPVQRAQGEGAVLVLQNYTFMPAHVQVPPGGTLVVLNQDRVPHELVSEAAAGAYAYGEVGGIGFDTGTIPPGGVAAITVPATAPVGTVVPFYCAYWLGAMTDEADLTVLGP